MQGKQHHYPTVTLLRGVAALMVCVFHFTSYSDYLGTLFKQDGWIYKIGALGSHGVTLFFVISGFVIPLSLSQSTFTRKEVIGYFKRRAIRIEIPYIVSILCILSTWIYFAYQTHTTFQFDPIQFIFHVFHLIPFSNYDWYNIIYWTLSIEFQFYIVAAFLMYFWIKKQWKVFYGLFILFILTSLIPQDIYYISKHSVVFGLGILLFLIKTGTLQRKTGNVLAVLGVVLVGKVNGIEVALFSAIGYLLIQFWEYKSRISEFFGQISYSLYLTHGLIGGTILYRLHPRATTLTMKFFFVSLAFTFSIIGAYLFWKIIENPAKKWAKRVSG